MHRSARLARILSVVGLLIGGTTTAKANCPSVPYTLTNGRATDATQVMANFAQLETCLDSGLLTVPPVQSLSMTREGGGTVSIENPAATSNYNFNLPANSGTTGQILASGGGGANAMTWITIPGTTLPPITDGIPVGRPAASLFVWRNPGTATYTEYANGPIVLTVPAQNGDQVRGFEQAVPTSFPYTLTTKISPLLWNSNFFTMGIYIIDTNGRFVSIHQQTGSGLFQIGHWNSVTSFNSTIKSNQISPKQSIWLRITNNGSNIIFYISQDGAEWIQYYSEPSTSFLGTAIAMGVYANNHDTTGVGLPSKISIWSFELENGPGTNSHW